MTGPDSQFPETRLLNQAVEANDSQGVARAGVGEKRLQPRSVHRAARADIGEHFQCAGLLQPQRLAGDVLIAGGYAIAQGARMKWAGII